MRFLFKNVSPVPVFSHGLTICRYMRDHPSDVFVNGENHHGEGEKIYSLSNRLESSKSIASTIFYKKEHLPPDFSTQKNIERRTALKIKDNRIEYILGAKQKSHKTAEKSLDQKRYLTFITDYGRWKNPSASQNMIW